MSVKWHKIILFGDSLTQGSFNPDQAAWGALLANKFQRNCDVITRGFSGYSSRSCRAILPYLFNSEMLLDVKAFVIFLGTNDVCDVMPEYHVPLEEFCDNITEIINFLKTNGLTEDKIVLLTPAPYHEETYEKMCKENNFPMYKRDLEKIGTYVEALVDIGKKFGINTINLYADMMKDEDWPKYLADGVHYSKEGGVYVFEKLLACLQEKIDTSTMLMPYWREINSIFPKDFQPELCPMSMVPKY